MKNDGRFFNGFYFEEKNKSSLKNIPKSETILKKARQKASFKKC
jgi:hypothetical protein